jgi:glycine/D-amino acid oxidase-like deaminating enzyme
MKTAIVGNGILGLMTAYRLIRRDPGVRLSIVGPDDHRGCASLAAAAMFNSFCEVDPGTLANKYEREKFLFNRSATPHWPSLLQQIQEESGERLQFGFGTFLVNNHATDVLEDETFEAVVHALEQFAEPFQTVKPADIPNYKPTARGRAARAIFIPGEGWVNPVLLVRALTDVLARSGRVEFIDGRCQSLERVGAAVKYLHLEGGERRSADVFFLASGATFSKIVAQSNLALDMPRIFYGVGCSVLLKTGELTLHNCVRTPNRGLACGIYAAPQDPAHTIVGASNFISPEPEDGPRLTSIHSLLESAMEQLNSDYYRSQLVKVNTGWRPTSEDTLPLLGKTSLANLFVATGTKRDGLHCAPVISDAITDLILTNHTATDLSLFRPERPPVRLYTREEAIETTVRHTINQAYQHGFTPSRSRMLEEMQRHLRAELEELHDRVGASDWGIPPELINMYKYGHIPSRRGAPEDAPRR